MKQHLYDLFHHCTVRIAIAGKVGYGTGFFIAPGCILTCAHVVKAASSGTVAIEVLWHGETYPAQQGYMGTDVDLAILHIDLTDHPCVFLHEEIHPFDSLYTYGYADDYPDGDPATFVLEGKAGEQGEYLKFKTGQVRPGFSGAPLLNTRTGYVCGIIRSTRDRNTDLGGRGISVTTIFNLLPAEIIVQHRQFHRSDQNWILCHKQAQSHRDQQAVHEPVDETPVLWNIPYPRNFHFTGREELLSQLAKALQTTSAAASPQPQAISGLGGIGKTQIVLEYAYRYCQHYQQIFWVPAETHETLISSYTDIAELLQLPEKDERNQTLMARAVTRWLTTHHNWLLILDNADDLMLVRDFVPRSRGGHVLLTTRAQATGRLARCITVNTMSANLGALFLLRRADIIASDEPLDAASPDQIAQAKAISEMLGGLPLALDQAGAYIEETQCSLQSYLEIYKTRHHTLLKYRGGLVDDHPESVAITWSLSFKKIEQLNPGATDLLRLCAFLYAESIPEELITEGLKYADFQIEQDPFLLEEMIRILRAYSLVVRETNNATISIHRLVQVVLKDTLCAAEQDEWKIRAFAAVNAVFPLANHDNWPLCERYLPHVLLCLAQMPPRQGKSLMIDIANLNNRTGVYLLERAQYSEAEEPLRKALQIREELLGPEHPDTALSLNDLGRLYRAQAKYAEAEQLWQRALKIREKVSGPEHLNVAQSLHNLGELYRAQSRYEEAEPLLRRALEIREKVLEPEHADVARSLVVLALLYRTTGGYDKAEPLQQRALEIREKVLGPDHPETALSLNILGGLYQALGKFEFAESPLQRALEIRERLLGPEHPHVAQSLNTLGDYYRALGMHDKAEPLLQRALKIREQKMGSENPETAQSFYCVAKLYDDQGKYKEAEELYQRSLDIREQKLGPESWDVAQSLNGLATFYVDQKKYTEAEQLYRRSFNIWQKKMGAQPSDASQDLSALALRILEKVIGTQPSVARSLDNLGTIYQVNGDNQKAEPLIKQALAIQTKVLGPQHPATQNVRAHYADLLRSMGKDENARNLEE